MPSDSPFDRRVRRLRRDRSSLRLASADYLHRRAADEIIERLALVNRDFTCALNLGCADGYLSAALKQRGMEVTCADAGIGFAKASSGVQCDEDLLPFAGETFDLVVSAGVLDTVNDLPGALTLIRRILRPDGLFLGAFSGAGSLPRLRRAMLAADAVESDAAAPRIHPQIDVRAAGDLLTRAGFALPVADCETISIRFDGLMQLVGDLRAMAATNILASRPARPILRRGLAAAIADFAEESDDAGKTVERVEIIYVTGWAPSPDQPRPAARGSATQSLAHALKPPSA